MKKQQRVSWISRSLVMHPAYIGVCISEEAFHRELKKLRVPREQWPTWVRVPADGTVHTFEHSKHGTCHIVCLRLTKEHDEESIVNVIAHEATHLWQYAEEMLGERAASKEFEAYAIGNLTAGIYSAYKKLKRCSRTNRGRQAKSFSPPTSS